MRREYGMRRQAVDGEIGLRDKLFFIEAEGERKTLSVLRLPLPHSLVSGPVKC